MLLLDDFKHGFAHRADYRIAAESVEMNFPHERLCDFMRRHHGGEGTTISNSLRHRDNVRNNIVSLEAPEMRSGSAEAGLHFICDTHAAGGTNVFVSLLEITLRKFHEAADSLDGFCDESGYSSRRGIINHLFHIR